MARKGVNLLMRTDFDYTGTASADQWKTRRILTPRRPFDSVVELLPVAVTILRATVSLETSRLASRPFAAGSVSVGGWWWFYRRHSEGAVLA
jgi:hypothetical protein